MATIIQEAPHRVASQRRTTKSGARVSAAGIGVVAALAASAWTLLFDRRVEHQELWSIVSAAFVLGILIWPTARPGLLRRVALAFLLLVTLVAALATADRVISAWEERCPRFGAVSSVANGALNLLGYRAATERGLLMLDHPDGVVTVVPSMEKLAARPFLLFGCAWVALWLARDHRRAAAASLVGLACLIAVALIRYVALVLVYAEHDNILAGSHGVAALEWFASPWVTCGFLILVGWLAGRAARKLPGEAPPEREVGLVRPRAWSLIISGTSVAALFGLAGFAGTYSPPGAVKGGRILVDDRFCGIWEPTARQLDTEWYGDFATYSFTSLAEWLGRWYAVDVNTSRPYDDKLLAGHDVLIIKTPEEPIPEAEAIDRFVHRGGGLLLVGDHTNLLGMGTHLNALSARYGIRFRYDSVSDGLTGGFVDVFGPLVGRHVGALHVDHLQFMTSCSLEISGRAETVLAADDCRREPHDYAGSSFFGRRGAHPEMEHGRTVLAATVRVGRGQIAAFTDSTVWSSFAVFSFDREKLAMDLVQMLNRQPSCFGQPFRLLASTAGFVAVILMLRRAGAGQAIPALALAFTCSWAGVALSDGLHWKIYAWPEPHVATSEVTFLWQGGACAFPPVLGTPESVPMDRSYDTLLVAVQRLGLVPRVAYRYGDDLFRPETRAMFVIAPVTPPPPETMARLRAFVRAGGSLIVMDDSRVGERGSARDFLDIFDATITYHGPEDGGKPHVHIGGMEAVPVPSGAAFVARKSSGRGQLVYVWDAAAFSREGMGHCFARPWREARARYELIYFLFRDLLRIAPVDRRFYGILGAGPQLPDGRTTAGERESRADVSKDSRPRPQGRQGVQAGSILRHGLAEETPAPDDGRPSGGD
jgi:hypothetical protein